ncbi:MAG: CDC48 family AAA ATPase [Candidatus Aenigmatarchaeota archaeon]
MFSKEEKQNGNKNPAAKLKVGELTGRDDFGRGLARIDSNTMKKIGVKEGDVIELAGKRNTVAIAIRSYPADVGMDVVRVDGLVRKNAGTSIGETVSVRKADVKEAKKVTLAPTEKGLVLHISPNLIKQNVFMRPMSKGDIIIANPVFRSRGRGGGDLFEQMFGINFEEVFLPMGTEMRLAVVNTEPAGAVQITELTQIEMLSEAVEIAEGKLPTVTYEDLGGLREVVPKIREMIETPLRHPEIFARLGVEPPKGVLLHGPPGCGKTLLAKAVANESGAHFISLAGPEIMSKFYGQSEENLRKVFEEAEKNSPSIIFLDEVDSIAPKREDVQGEVERRVVSQLLTMMDGLKSRGKVVVIAATNRPNALDPALRRPGRFDREIEIPVPDKKGRKEILQIHTRNMPLDKTVDIDRLAEITYGFVGADLAALAKEAAMHSLKRVLPELSELKEEEQLPKEFLEKLLVTKEDFDYALRMVQPSAMREVLVEVPKVKWDDVGGLEEVKGSLKEAVEWPLKSPDSFKRLGINPPRGIMLYGPPGCGKTFIVKALANESGANFIAIKGPELLSKWVGESEQHVRDVFRRAKQVAPCIVFFDEIDALAPRRGMDSGSHVTEQVVSQMLTEMSGIEDMNGVVIVAATNRPDIVDPALLRPGRFDRLIYVPAPDKKTRLEILKKQTRNMPLKGTDLDALAEKTEGYSGADLEALVREAALFALRDDMKAKEVTKKNFDEALKKIKPSITEDMFRKYQKAVEELKKSKMEEGEKTSRYIG